MFNKLRKKVKEFFNKLDDKKREKYCNELEKKWASEKVEKLQKETDILKDRYKDVELCEYCKYPENHCECRICATCGIKEKDPETCSTCEAGYYD